MPTPRLFTASLLISSLGLMANAHATNLNIEVFNPGAASIFPVSSEIISGDHQVALIDAQFQRNDAQTLVARIKATGKTLTTVYISHSDPDYYFGLDVIKANFPQAKIIATKATIAAITATKDGKKAYWGPILKGNAPQSIIVPQPLDGNSFTIDGKKLEVKGLDGPAPERTFVWIPSVKAVVGGVAVAENIHLWVADTQTPTSRRYWRETLKKIAALKPEMVVPGHFLPPTDYKLNSVNFSLQYLDTLEKELPKSKNSAALIAAMKTHYPQLQEQSSLELSARVLKGEMKWPQ
ncbi:MBL fold metallo-hydrolase [Rahnella sp. SAP-1]|uniref:MBL fold metallo-hydrolase n=1 Tax=Rouxiella aceris TaxID=2703884 RepID=A0A848MM18_9GAMM|nr:MBL fold metallo-hydrolase [Rouxiella aceris]